MRKLLILFAVFILSLSLTACAKNGCEYLGKWQDPARPNSGTLEISRNGDSYLVKITVPGMFGGKAQTTTVPASAKDGLLQMEGALHGTTLTHVKDTDGLLLSGGFGGNAEMKRVK
jgi:hypothetical protein